jgi:single-strand DNA-binding protein
MAGETSATVIGNLTSDPELRYTQGGLAVANFTIAANSRHFDKKVNDWVDDEPLFLTASVWRDLAEHVNATLKKGMGVIAVGNLKQRSFETKEGEKRTVIELDIQSIGPDLRFQVAQVTRSQSSRTQQDNRVAAATTPTVGGDEPWNMPGNYNDETPF